jgi:hypothetical protein
MARIVSDSGLDAWVKPTSLKREVIDAKTTEYTMPDPVTEPGMYAVGDHIFKVQESKTSGNLYANRPGLREASLSTNRNCDRQPVTMSVQNAAMNTNESANQPTVKTFCVCSEGQHPIYPDCDRCKGDGHFIGGDDYRPCPTCRLRHHAEKGA